jgi:muramoyltetrapeptide carboxypeptidase
MSINRRTFSKLALAAAAVSAMTSIPVRATTTSVTVKPRSLRAGDTVALITPGGFVDNTQIDTAVRNVESLGLKAKLLPNVRAARGNYAGTVKERVDDLHAAFRDPKIAALWAIRGGSGCAQILPALNYELIRNHPKIVLGYSDITALLLALYRRTGLVTFHGPVGISTFSDYSVAHLRAVLFEGRRNFTVGSAADNEAKSADAPEYAPRTLRAGVAEGTLVGGNLAVLSALIGTPYMPSLASALLFLEEIGEAPYRIDRMLTQLRQGAARPAGVAFGVFRRCDPDKDERSLTLNETLLDFAQQQRVPGVAGLSFGHIAHQMTLPIGIRARLDSGKKSLTFLDSAVSRV